MAELTGQRFGSLTVTGRVGHDKARGFLWSLRCDCGAQGDYIRSTRELRKLRRGACHKCVTRAKATHGETGTPLYRRWNSMKERCANPSHRFFRNYGGKGVAVCSEWQRYEGFKAWALASGFSYDPSLPLGDRLSLDRIDPAGNYEPANCRWIPQRVNCQRLKPAQGVCHLPV